MEVFLLIVSAVLASGLLYCGRLSLSNNRTYDQRIQMLNEIREIQDDQDYQVALDSFRSVDYHEHMREVFWGRDPFKLYQHLNG